MDNQSSFSRYILVVLCVSVVLTAIILVILNAWVKNKSLGNLNYFAGGSYEQGYKDGFLAAKNKYSLAPIKAEITSMEGVITKLSGKGFYMDVSGEGVSGSRQVMLEAKTEIFSRTAVSAKELEARFAAWRKAGAKNGQDPPKPYEDKLVNASSLIIGQKVLVTAAQDVSGLDSFTAKTIVVMPAAK